MPFLQFVLRVLQIPHFLSLYFNLRKKTYQSNSTYTNCVLIKVCFKLPNINWIWKICVFWSKQFQFSLKTIRIKGRLGKLKSKPKFGIKNSLEEVSNESISNEEGIRVGQTIVLMCQKSKSSKFKLIFPFQMKSYITDSIFSPIK